VRHLCTAIEQPGHKAANGFFLVSISVSIEYIINMHTFHACFFFNLVCMCGACYVFGGPRQVLNCTQFGTVGRKALFSSGGAMVRH
jgi:hypothetical protein